MTLDWLKRSTHTHTASFLLRNVTGHKMSCLYLPWNSSSSQPKFSICSQFCSIYSNLLVHLAKFVHLAVKLLILIAARHFLLAPTPVWSAGASDHTAFPYFLFFLTRCSLVLKALDFEVEISNKLVNVYDIFRIGLYCINKYNHVVLSLWFLKNYLLSIAAYLLIKPKPVYLSLNLVTLQRVTIQMKYSSITSTHTVHQSTLTNIAIRLTWSWGLMSQIHGIYIDG